MTKPFSLQIPLCTPEATAAFAATIAPLLEPGNTLLLSGDVGVGKTHFARALIQARLSKGGVTEDIPSPTYTLVQTYNDGICDIWHADLYRVFDDAEVVELGLVDAFQEAVCLVEWPDRLGAYVPENPLWIKLSTGRTPEYRDANIAGNLPYWGKILPTLMASSDRVTSNV